MAFWCKAWSLLFPANLLTDERPLSPLPTRRNQDRSVLAFALLHCWFRGKGGLPSHFILLFRLKIADGDFCASKLFWVSNRINWVGGFEDIQPSRGASYSQSTVFWMLPGTWLICYHWVKWQQKNWTLLLPYLSSQRAEKEFTSVLTF